jgi:hypothetical protein
MSIQDKINEWHKAQRELLEKAIDMVDPIEKGFGADLQKKFPNGGWRTINGARVFVDGGKVVAGLEGFKGKVEDAFKEKKTEPSKKAKVTPYSSLSKEQKNMYNGSIESFARLSSDKVRTKRFQDTKNNLDAGKFKGDFEVVGRLFVKNYEEGKLDKKLSKVERFEIEEQPKSGTIDSTIQKTKEAGFDKLVTDSKGNMFILNESNNEKWPVTKKDYKKYQDKLHEAYGKPNEDKKKDELQAAMDEAKKTKATKEISSILSKDALDAGMEIDKQFEALSSKEKKAAIDKYKQTSESKDFVSKKEEREAPKSKQLESLMKIMDSRIKNNGYSLKQLYDEVVWGKGIREGALIFSEFIKRKKDQGDSKIMKEFNETSFVENINPSKK